MVAIISSPTVSEGVCVEGEIDDDGAALTVILVDRSLMRADLLLELAFRLAASNVTVPALGNETGTVTVHESVELSMVPPVKRNVLTLETVV